MEKLSIDTFLKRLDELPLDIKEGVLNVDFLQEIREIQKAQKLHIDQGAALENLIFNIILGNIEESEFLHRAKEEIQIDENQVILIESMVNEKILNPIKREIERLQEENSFLNEESTEEALPKPTESGDYSKLSTENILAEIEDPQPSIGVTHETVVMEKVAPVIQNTPVKIENHSTQVPAGWPIPANQTAAPAVAAPSPIVSALNQKLEQPTVIKPVEIKHSLDPYKEAVE